MKKFLTILMLCATCAALIFAAVKTEVRMYVHQRTDGVWKTAVTEIDSVDFCRIRSVDRIAVYRNGDNEAWCPAVENVDSIRFQTDTVIVSNVEGAAGNAVFAVSDSRLVHFSKGNLQFKATLGTHATADSFAPGTWRFAERQYDHIGEGNENIDSTYNGWIDLFCWGTSGWNSGAKKYQPWERSYDPGDFIPGNDSTANLTGKYANADWGVYNAIKGGGDKPGLWRTLTYEEWIYLFQNNPWTMAWIDGTLCFLLLPDTVQSDEIKVGMVSNGTTDTTVSVPTEILSANTFTAEEFEKLELMGAVALPCTGVAYQKALTLEKWGHYSSSTTKHDAEINAWCFSFLDRNATANDFFSHERGLAVRLVQDVFITLRFKNYDGQEISTVTTNDLSYRPDSLPKRISALGDTIYTFNGWKMDNNRTTDTITYVASYTYEQVRENGTLFKSAFKISDKQKVYFSQGNLQFNADLGSHKTADNTTAAGTWRFARNQYDYVGNTLFVKDNNGWIDLFCWGTSGWDSGAKEYQPWSYTDNGADFQPGADSTGCLTGEYANADWGVFNAISNGGDEPGVWRTLSAQEWKYLFQNNYWTVGKVNGTNCFLLIPEDFTQPDNVKVQNIYINTTPDKMVELDLDDYAKNDYTEDQFLALESRGVVALPYAGFQNHQNSGNGLGHYWSTTAGDPLSAKAISFSLSGVGTVSDFGRNYGRSVRLAKEVPFTYVVRNPDGTVIDTKTTLYGTYKLNFTPVWETTIDSIFLFSHLEYDESRIANDTIFCNAIYSSKAADVSRNGALVRGRYWISDKQKVCFSQGNLQFNAELGSHKTAGNTTATGTWRFAENQYGYIGDTLFAKDDNGWCDLFSWGTSGWSGKADSSLVGDNAQADWGVYNAISNGGNQPGVWRTLTSAEWQYLLAHNQWTLGSVNDTACLFLYPEKFVAPASAPLKDYATVKAGNFTGNDFTIGQFAELEKLGVVALPYGGNVSTDMTYNAGTGNYWSATAAEDGTAHSVCFSANSVDPDTLTPRLNAHSVRLVQNMTYTFVFLNEDNKVIRTEKHPYGFDSYGSLPSKKDGDYNIYFDKWERNNDKEVNDTIILQAVFHKEKISENGALTRAYFKVSDTDSVYFSQGNLQFNAALDSHKTSDGNAQGTWRFAPNQYDVIAEGNSKISSSYNGWIDLFGWATSGWYCKSKCYQPWSTSADYKDYAFGTGIAFQQLELRGDHAKSDWGVYNAISNGGGEPGKWRTLAYTEWLYLFFNNRWAVGTVEGTPCYLLIPKDFQPGKVSVVEMDSSKAVRKSQLIETKDNETYYATYHTYVTFDESCYAQNTFTKEQFLELESHGVVALPCGGARSGNSVETSSYGFYWSASHVGCYSQQNIYSFIKVSPIIIINPTKNYAFNSDARGFSILPFGIDIDGNINRSIGLSVRLVQDVK